MDLSGIAGNLPLLIGGIILVILMQVLFMRRNKPDTQKAIVQSLLLDVKINQAISDLVKEGQKPKRFSSNNYKMNKNRIDFLAESLKTSLSNAFDMVEDYNQQIRQARKAGSYSYVDLNFNKLNEPLVKSRQGLEDWLMANGGQQQGPPIKLPGIFDNLFGTGR